MPQHRFLFLTFSIFFSGKKGLGSCQMHARAHIGTGTCAVLIQTKRPDAARFGSEMRGRALRAFQRSSWGLQGERLTSARRLLVGGPSPSVKTGIPHPPSPPPLISDISPPSFPFSLLQSNYALSAPGH